VDASGIDIAELVSSKPKGKRNAKADNKSPMGRMRALTGKLMAVP